MLFLERSRRCPPLLLLLVGLDDLVRARPQLEARGVVAELAHLGLDALVAHVFGSAHDGDDLELVPDVALEEVALAEQGESGFEKLRLLVHEQVDVDAVNAELDLVLRERFSHDLVEVDEAVQVVA